MAERLFYVTPVIALLGLHRLSPRNQVLRDRVLAGAYTEAADSVRHMAQYHGLAPGSVGQVIEPYQAWVAAADVRDEAERVSGGTALRSLLSH